MAIFRKNPCTTIHENLTFWAQMSHFKGKKVQKWTWWKQNADKGKNKKKCEIFIFFDLKNISYYEKLNQKWEKKSTQISKIYRQKSTK